MSRWLKRADDLLYDGESVETREDVGAGGVVVTSHRVFAFTPDRDGANFRDVDRPNVVGVERTNAGRNRFLGAAVKALVVGAALLAVGRVVSLDGLVESIDLTTTGGLGMGGFLGLMQSLLDLLAMVDEIATALGAVALLVGSLFLGLYARSREALLVIEVAGGEDVELPAGDAGVADRLNRAVRPDAPASPAATGTEESTGADAGPGDSGPGDSDRDPLA